jgi:hypothetical protein
MTKYKLFVRLNDKNLIYHIEDYEILDSGYYKIFDAKTQTFRIFDSRICEIVEEVSENEI